MLEWNLKPFTSESVFKLLKSSSEEINSLNKGFNRGDTTIGFFHFVGYDPDNKTYLVSKPRQEIDEPKLQSFVFNENFYLQTCQCLLSFTLNNN